MTGGWWSGRRLAVVKWWLVVRAPIGNGANWHSPWRSESTGLRVPIADGRHPMGNNHGPIVPNEAAVYKTAAKVHAAPIDIYKTALLFMILNGSDHIIGLAPGVKVKWTKMDEMEDLVLVSLISA